MPCKPERLRPSWRSLIDHRLILIGDSGDANPDDEPALDLLEERVRVAPYQTTVVFLGDNVYETGMPDPTDLEGTAIEAVLDEVTGQLEGCFSALNGLPGKAGQSLTENDWLMSIRSRVGIPGGTCEFDLPAYYAWQHLQTGVRKQDLQRWITPLVPLAESIRVLLTLLRDSGAPQKVVAPAGQYQQTLPQGRTFQLLRLRIDPALGLIPEISGNRLIVSVRLMRHGSDDRLHASTEDSAFELTLCS